MSSMFNNKKDTIMNANVQLVKTILKYTFGLVPMVAGLDKFTNILTDWSQAELITDRSILKVFIHSTYVFFASAWLSSSRESKGFLPPKLQNILRKWKSFAMPLFLYRKSVVP